MTNADSTESTGRIVNGRLNALLAGVRLVAIDLETCNPHGQPPRIVAVGAVTTRPGRPPGKYSTLVDPEAPIDDVTYGIHGIADDDVLGWPTFDAVAPLIEQLLDDSTEAVVLVAHNAGSDIAVLKAEFDRVGRTLPDVPVLDTANKTTLDLLGVHRASRSLPDVGAAVDVEVVDHHDALADAHACSRIARRLLGRAAERGYDDLAVLLQDANGGRTTAATRAATSRTSAGRAKHARPRRRLPQQHVATHAQLLPTDPTDDDLEQWTDLLLGCAGLRCPMTRNRVGGTDAPHAVQRGAVEKALRTLLDGDEPDASAVATLLGALAELADGLEPLPGRLGLRRAAFAWADGWADELDALGRCGKDACPDCRAGLPCPLDTWREPLAELAFTESRDSPRGVLRPTGENRGTGAYTTWISKGRDQQLADAALAVCVQHYRDTDDDARGRTVAQFGWDAGCRHPDIAALVADARADAGTEADLQAAVHICDTVLAAVDGSSSASVQRLHTTHARLSGLLARSRGRQTGDVDEDGNPVFAPRHHPTDPKRPPRPRRFTA